MDLPPPSFSSPEDVLLWWESPTTLQYGIMIGLPIGSLLLIYFFLRIVWRPKDPKFRLPSSSKPTYGAVPEGPSSPMNDVIQAGQVAGAYTDDWKSTFDMAFAISMVFFALFLFTFTKYAKPELFTNGEFWLYMIPKIVAMMGVSTIGGLICRQFCDVDELGYVITNQHSWFKVNYTRKLQHCAAYFIPLYLKPSAACNCNGPLELAW